MVISYDLMGLKHYWSHLDRRFFSKLSHEAYKNVNKLETSLLRLYLVHAIQNSKQEKVTEFFEKCASELQNVSSWKDWFGKLLLNRVVYSKWLYLLVLLNLMYCSLAMFNFLKLLAAEYFSFALSFCSYSFPEKPRSKSNVQYLLHKSLARFCYGGLVQLYQHCFQ